MLFGRNPKIPRKIHTENSSDNFNYWNIPQEILDKNIEIDLLLKTKIKDEVLENISRVQNKQKKRFEEQRQNKLKAFSFKIGDKVLRKNLKIINKFGYKTQPKWLGSYMIVTILHSKS